MDETYGAMIARLRNERGWTQQELSDRSGVPKRTIQEIEGSGPDYKPQRRSRTALGQALEIPGSPEQEQADYPKDVETALLITGAYLMRISPDERLDFIRWISERAVANG